MKNNIINKKAQIASTMVWIIAFIIVVVLMAGYLVIVGKLAVESEIKEDSKEINFEQMKMLEISALEDNFIGREEIDFSKPDLLAKFLSEHSDEVYRWADSDLSIDFEKYNRIKEAQRFGKDTNIYPETQKLYDDILNNYSDFLQKNNLNHIIFYIRTENKEINIETDNKQLFWEVTNPLQGGFASKGGLYSFRKDEELISQDIPEINEYKFYAVSDNGTLIMFVFYLIPGGQNA